MPPTIAHADARFWDRNARRYAADPIADLAGYERTLERTRDYLSATDTVLEIGCGTATTALRLAPDVGRILATDISPEMIAIAREKRDVAGCPNADLAVASPVDAPWPDAAFDHVLAFNVLHLLRARGAVLAQLHRVLKPGGLLITKTPCLSEMNPLIRLAVPVMKLVGRAPHVAFFTGADLEREIAAAGFTVVERARHGTGKASGRRDPRVFLVARKPGSGALASAEPRV